MLVGREGGIRRELMRNDFSALMYMVLQMGLPVPR